jgi:hypothetical protein
VTGTSHIRVNKGCDDNGGCIVVPTRDGEVLIAVVSDGAGSAEYSAIGSRIVVRRFLRCASTFVRSGMLLEQLTEQSVSDWLDDIRDHIGVRAIGVGASPRSFAATLVGAIVTRDRAVIIHIGDGAAVFRLKDLQDWKVGSWPASGEYASTTFFVTDDPQPKLRMTHIEGVVSEISLFTDGIERLVLDFAGESAFSPFFNKVFSAFSEGDGRDRPLSKNLGVMLQSPSVCERTDDDKTIILGRRS